MINRLRQREKVRHILNKIDEAHSFQKRRIRLMYRHVPGTEADYYRLWFQPYSQHASMVLNHLIFEVDESRVKTNSLSELEKRIRGCAAKDYEKREELTPTHNQLEDETESGGGYLPPKSNTDTSGQICLRPKTKPLVSVVIPTHNRTEMLRSAIVSVQNQTFQDFEIIIVDDFSSNNTQEVVQSFKDPKIKYYRLLSNKGPGAARNVGILNSHGIYIAFLDDDDEWLPDKLTKQVPLLENSTTDFGGVYTSIMKIDAVSGKTLNLKRAVKRGNLYSDLFVINCIITSSVLLKRECFEKIGLFDEKMQYGEDLDIWIRISKDYKWECLSDVLVKYRCHQNQISKNLSLLIRSNEIRIEKYKQQHVALTSKGYSRHYYDLGILYCLNGNVRKGRTAFAKAIRLTPLSRKPYLGFLLSLLGAHVFKKVIEIKNQ